jgi:hypothetical protein
MGVQLRHDVIRAGGLPQNLFARINAIKKKASQNIGNLKNPGAHLHHRTSGASIDDVADKGVDSGGSGVAEVL